MGISANVLVNIAKINVHTTKMFCLVLVLDMAYLLNILDILLNKALIVRKATYMTT